MSVLVTGGAGYIGSHAVLALLERGREVVVLDNLSTAHGSWCSNPQNSWVGDIGDSALVERLLRERRVEAVLHFAGSIVVPDSVREPLAYYENNTVNPARSSKLAARKSPRLHLFLDRRCLRNAGQAPVTEDSDTRPDNPYGRSKLMTEWMHS